MPGECRTFCAHRVFTYSREYGKFSQAFRGRFLGGNQIVKVFKKPFRLIHALSFHAFRHERRGSRADGTPYALKSRILHLVLLELKVDRDSITAQRVMSLRRPIRVAQPAKIARLPAVVDYDFLIKIAQVRNHASISCTFKMPEARASISSRVL